MAEEKRRSLSHSLFKWGLKRRRADVPFQGRNPSPTNHGPLIQIINKPGFPNQSSRAAIPSQVRCRLVIILDKKEHRPQIEPVIQWLDPDSYQDLEKARDHGVNEAARTHDPVVKGASYINGDITLFHSVENSTVDKEIAHRLLLQEHDWKETMPVMVAKFAAAHPYSSFYLEVRWYFSSVLETTSGKGTMIERMKMAMCHNWEENVEYLSRSELERLFPEDQVRELVYRDTLLSQSLEKSGKRSKDEIVEKVLLFALRLFAICVWIDRPLIALKFLLDKGLTDTDLPLMPEQRPELLGERIFENIMLVQARFCVLDFVDNGPDGDKYYDVPNHMTVPIHFKAPEDKLGQGTFGQVFKATIHSDHHQFPSARSKCFALKRYIGGPTKKSDFLRERDVLRILSQVPDLNDNIVTHLACWTHKQEFFMLFPMAETNLAAYLRDTPAQSMTKSFALWVLEQLFNLAQGVENIHIIRAARVSELEAPEDAYDSDFGYHHDLKPANILIFRTDKGYVWKIGDFGNARINKAVKGKSQKTPNFTMGDAVYESPDWHVYKETSRPYDIWSLGCIFLEVLVWLFWSKPGEGLGEFEARRKKDDGYRGYAAYWFVNPKNRVDHRPSVIEVMRALERQTQGFFRQVVTITTPMLSLKPTKRPPASWVTSSLKSARVQANFELGKMAPDDIIIDDQSIMRLPQSLPFAAPVTLPRTRRDTVDGRSIISRRDSTPPPGPSLSNAERSPTSESKLVEEQLTGLGDNTLNQIQPWPNEICFQIQALNLLILHDSHEDNPFV